MSFIPLPDDKVLQLQQDVDELWNRLAKEDNYSTMSEFLRAFKKTLIQEFGIEGPQARYFLIGMLAGDMYARQLLRLLIDEVLMDRYAKPKEVL
jgi:hypothetical protein